MKTPYELFGWEIGKGWYDLVKPLVEECNEKGYTITQIKEKYGGLRFYVASCPEEFWDRVDKAEQESYTICEECGEPGELRSGGWMKTLCDKHAREKGYE